MSYIKGDIVVFGIGVFIFMVVTCWIVLEILNGVIMPLLGCAIVSNNNDRIAWFSWVKVTVISFKFYCSNAYSEYGNEYSLHRIRFLQLRKSLIIYPKQRLF